MKPLLCVTVTAPTTAELRRRRDEVVDADLIELRLDFVGDLNVAEALAGRRRPVIVTCRPQWEGGRFAGSEERRRQVLAEALALGAEYVDIEWRAGFSELIARTGGRRIVLSSHDFVKLPDDAAERVRAMRATGAEVVKLAVKLGRLTDCVRLMEIGAEASGGDGLVLVGLGECGIATRVLPGRFGSMWTYAGGLKDIGQASAAALVHEYRFREICESTAIYGLVGNPVAQSVSPAMHNAAFERARLNAVYLPLPAADVEDFLQFARAFGVRGASVTVPYKVLLLDVVDDVQPLARRIGAINTISVEQGRWIGANTDWHGCLAPLRALGSLSDLRVSILGAGGAARAVAVALVSAGASVTVHARSQQRAEEVAMNAGAAFGRWPPAPGSWDLLVNCTPIGMHPDIEHTPMPAEQLTGRYVYDLVYNPPMTRLLRDAAAMGRRTIGGLDMLVGQAHEQFHLWTGTRPDPGVMREAALRRLAEFEGDENHVV